MRLCVVVDVCGSFGGELGGGGRDAVSGAGGGLQRAARPRALPAEERRPRGAPEGDGRRVSARAGVRDRLHLLSRLRLRLRLRRQVGSAHEIEARLAAEAEAGPQGRTHAQAVGAKPPGRHTRHLRRGALLHHLY